MYLMSSYKKQVTLKEEAGQASEPDTTGMLELSDWEFKTAMINVLRSLIVKVARMHNYWAV